MCLDRLRGQKGEVHFQNMRASGDHLATHGANGRSLSSDLLGTAAGTNMEDLHSPGFFTLNFCGNWSEILSADALGLAIAEHR